MEFINLNLNLLIEQYQNGASLRYLARQYKTSHLTIKKKLQKAGVTIHSSQDQLHRDWNKHRIESKPTSKLTEQLLIELWNKQSINYIAKETGATAAKIKGLAKKLKLPKYQPPTWTPNVDWDSRNWLFDHYVIKQMSLNELANILSSTSETIKKKLIKHDIPIRSLQESVKNWNAKPETKLLRSRVARNNYPKSKAALIAGRNKYLDALPPVPYKNKTWLKAEYTTKNAARIAREQNIHHVTIKYWLIKHGIYNPDNCRRWMAQDIKEAREKSRQLWKDATYIVQTVHATNFSRIVDYSPIKSNKDKIRFRSQLECGYAIMLDLDDEVAFWFYESQQLEYDGGRIYTIDFTIFNQNNKCRFIEVKPFKRQNSATSKYSQAKAKLPWRFSTKQENKLSQKLFKNGYLADNVSLINTWPQNRETYTAWSKEKNIKQQGWEVLKTKRYGGYYTHKMQQIIP